MPVGYLVFAQIGENAYMPMNAEAEEATNDAITVTLSALQAFHLRGYAVQVARGGNA